MPVPASGIAVFGGTFDPVHIGHLRSAIEVREALSVDRIRLIPSFQPPHRGQPGSTPDQRLEMLRIATRGVDCFEVDDREILRAGKSYSVETLRSIRREIGSDTPLTMTLGFDAFLLLHEWFEWRQLTDYAHLAVLSRPGADERQVGPELTDFVKARFVDDPLCLHSKPSGLICQLKLTQIDVSSSQVREILSKGRSPAYIVPEDVIAYIREHGLYGVTTQ